MRLNVYLQKAGIGSRREAERFIAENRIAVNGKIANATIPVEEGDKVTIDGREVTPDTRGIPRLFMLHKPVDVLVTNRDPKGRPTIFDMPVLKQRHLPRLMSVGRLDVNSEGLLLLSDDGPLAQAMMSPATALSRVYRVRMRGRLTDAQVKQLSDGIEVDGVNYRGATFVEEVDKGGRTNSWYRVMLTEGKNREIRKLVEHFGGAVNRLIRVQYGPFQLEGLESGKLKEVPQKDVERLIAFLKTRGAVL